MDTYGSLGFYPNLPSTIYTLTHSPNSTIKKGDLVNCATTENAEGGGGEGTYCTDDDHTTPMESLTDLEMASKATTSLASSSREGNKTASFA